MQETQERAKSAQKPVLLTKEPKLITLLQNKGGSFRTSICWALVKDAIRSKKTVRAIDFDQQQNLKKMLPEITMNGSNTQISEIHDIEADVIICDTPPTIDNMLIQLALKSDLILIPIHLSRFDVEQAQALLTTLQALQLSDRAKIILIHSGTRSNLYKNLEPLVREIADSMGVEILCELTRNASVPQGLLLGQTVFEFPTPPKVREEMKNLFKQVNRQLAKS